MCCGRESRREDQTVIETPAGMLRLAAPTLNERAKRSSAATGRLMSVEVPLIYPS